jgi:tetratricopeptide (TPR) repeat protein
MQGYGEGALRLLLLATSIGVWWYAMMGVEDILLGLLLFEVFQLVQGLTVVWRVASTGEGADSGMAALYRCSVCWVIVYLVVFSAYGTVFVMGRVPSEGIVITDVTVRFIAALAAATLAVQYLFDEVLVWRLKHPVTSPREKPAAKGLLPRLGSAVVWVGAVVTAGWLAASARNANDLSLQVYDNVVTAYPGSWRAHTGLAVELIKIGEFPSALEELTLAAELNPDAAEVRIELGRMLHTLNQTDKAVEEFRRAIELNPAASTAYTELGKTLFAQGQVQEGLAYLQDALKRRPQDPVAHIDIALAHASIRDWENALSSFDAAISLDPEFAIAYNGRGNVLWSKGDLDAALKEYNEAIRIDPKVAKPYRNRAGVWLEKREIEKAVNDMALAIELDGSNAEDFVRRGDLFYSQEKFDLALKDYETAAQLEQQFTTPIERLVTLWTSCPNEEFRNLESAVAAARSACEMTEWRSPSALQMLAGVLAAQGKYDEALRWQSQAVDLASSETREAFQQQLDVFKRLSQGSDTDDSSPGS